MKNRGVFGTFCLFSLLVLSCQKGPRITFQQQEYQIDVMVDGQHMTTYQFDPDLPKPILYPVKSPSGVVVNRHFPMKMVEGESRDHPHHTGLFFTYDEVNADGFWNNTEIPPQIRHIKMGKMKGDKKPGELSVILHWIGQSGKILLEEHRTMIFYPGPEEHTIDFTLTLTAKDTTVLFHDTKEGMFGIRVAPWLREKGGSGRYLSANGDETEANVWGKRASWVRLEGKYEEKPLGIAILNHPRSTNYPTYWHARGYGLFAANPLGQYVFQKARKDANPGRFGLTLKKGESTVFRFRMLIYEGHKTKQLLDEAFEEYTHVINF